MLRRCLVATVVVLGAPAVAGPAHAVDPPLPDVSQVESGTDHTCAVAAGAAWCWGDDTDGKLGDGAAASTGIASRVLDITNSGPLLGPQRRP
jgi:hypothetical protein